MSSIDLDRQDLKQLLIESLQLDGMTPAEIGDDDPLFGEGLGLDSVDALELVVALEKRLGVRIRSDQIDPNAFSTIASLHAFIERRKAESPESGGAGDPAVPAAPSAGAGATRTADPSPE